MHPLQERVRLLMEGNRRTTDGNQYTLPSPELYPFQWLWDSCFHSIILSKFDQKAAKAELRSAFSRPLPSGMFPHIIYWEDPTTVNGNGNWGREMRGDIINASWGTIGTSSITQPSVMAFAVRRVFEENGDNTFLIEVYPALKNHFDYLAREREVPKFEPLVAILNPDESGEDNSPRFDDALDLPPIHIPDLHLDARLNLMKQYASCRFEVTDCMDAHFSVIDLPFNILYAEDMDHLAFLADVLGKAEDGVMYRTRAEAVRKALREKLFHKGRFRSYDVTHETYIAVETWADFTPLYGGLLSQDEARSLVETHLLNEEKFWTPYPVPTTARSEASFDASDGFWRGPVWITPNWFIYKGLQRYGFDDVAQKLKQKTESLIQESGFREQYNPLTGEGKGGENFTWGGLVLDME